MRDLRISDRRVLETGESLDLITSGDKVSAIEVDNDIGSLIVDGTVRASGANSEVARMSAHQLDLTTLRIDLINRTN